MQQTMHQQQIDFLKRLARGVAAQFGDNCEVVVHDLKSSDPDSTIVAIENGQITGRKINYDTTLFMAMQEVLKGFTALTDAPDPNPETIPHNVTDLLDELIEQSVRIVGKPVALMSKEDKVRAIGFLNDSGAFLVTKSGQKVCNYFGISKYTLYSYMDEAKRAAGQE